MKFRKKPIVVEAEQFYPEGNIPDGVFVKDENSSCFIAANEQGVFELVGHIETLEGIMIVRRGDWIITETNGQKYPCKRDIFEKIYERVEE